MPYALTVDSSAGQLQAAPKGPSELSARLMALDCCIETCGWSTNATVIIQRDAVAHTVFRNLMLAGCSVLDGRRLDFEYEPPGERPVQRHLQPWNFVRRNRDNEPEIIREPERPMVVELKDSDAAAHRERIEAFILELREILSQKNLDPENFNALLEEARRITAEEDPVTGPHHGLIIALETIVKTRATVPELGKSVSA